MLSFYYLGSLNSFPLLLFCFVLLDVAKANLELELLLPPLESLSSDKSHFALGPANTVTSLKPAWEWGGERIKRTVIATFLACHLWEWGALAHTLGSALTSLLTHPFLYNPIRSLTIPTAMLL